MSTPEQPSIGTWRGERGTARPAHLTALARGRGPHVFASLLALIVWSMTCGASLAATWSVQRVAKPAHLVSGSLDGLSCTSTYDCTAVGSYQTATGGQQPLTERWNGIAWSIPPTTRPTGSNNVALSGVSCTSPTACTAVGAFEQRDRTIALVERWDGTRWSLQNSNPARDTDTAFVGVSCTTATACTAVGLVDAGYGGPLIERWDGVRWSSQPTPAIPDLESAELEDISCASTTSCVAVGNFTTQSDECLQPLVEVWDGSAWTAQPLPAVGGCNSDLAGLRGVSCTSLTLCTAVGYDDRRESVIGTGTPLVENANGGTSGLQSTPDLTYLEDPWGGGGWFEDVSCTTTPTSCVAVGTASSEIIARPLVERWDGTAWRLQSMPKMPHDGGLFAVSCISATACTAVGYDDSHSFVAVPMVESTLGPSRARGARPVRPR